MAALAENEHGRKESKDRRRPCYPIWESEMFHHSRRTVMHCPLSTRTHSAVVINFSIIHNFSISLSTDLYLIKCTTFFDFLDMKIPVNDELLDRHNLAYFHP